jgi:hypothetical protein
MSKFFIFSLLSSATLFPLVKACSLDAEGHTRNSIVGFGFFGGIVSALIIIALILGIMVLNKKNMKGGKQHG